MAKELIDLNFDWKLKNLNGSEMEGEEDGCHAGKLLAGLLARANEVANPVKYHDWALKLYNREPLQIDDADLEDLKKFIKTHKTLFVFAQAQILKCITDREKKAEEAAK